MLHEETVRVVRRFTLVYLSLFFCQVICAQGTVTNYGTVTDPSGAAIAGAKVTVTNQSTEQSRDTVSALDGNYVVPGALVPVHFKNGRGLYVEPNVWVRHQV